MPERDGVFPSQWIRKAIDEGIVVAAPELQPGQVQPNSLDLRLSSSGCRIQCSFLPGEEGLQHKLSRFKWYDVRLPEEGVVLERNQIYLFELCESLYLPDDVYARANPKSSTGRLDVFTRLVTEHGDTFDEAPAGYRGRLWLEVVPRSFAIRVRPGDALAQIRFQTGQPYLTPSETAELIDREAIILGPSLETLGSQDVYVKAGVTLSVSLPKNDKTIGYVARKNQAPIDLRAVGGAPIRHYWDRIHGDSRPVILEPDDFYIFASRELVRLPGEYCAEMVAFDASSGEVRTHYAGFFDSGFGYASHRAPTETAAAVVLEVRSRDVPFLIEDGQPLFRVHILRNTEPPDLLYGSQLSSHYQSQRLRLSKQFTAPIETDDESGRRGSAQSRLDFSPR
jgi:dCTP deaminase